MKSIFLTPLSTHKPNILRSLCHSTIVNIVLSRIRHQLLSTFNSHFIFPPSKSLVSSIMYSSDCFGVASPSYFPSPLPSRDIQCEQTRQWQQFCWLLFYFGHFVGQLLFRPFPFLITPFFGLYCRCFFWRLFFCLFVVSFYLALLLYVFESQRGGSYQLCCGQHVAQHRICCIEHVAPNMLHQTCFIKFIASNMGLMLCSTCWLSTVDSTFDSKHLDSERPTCCIEHVVSNLFNKTRCTKNFASKILH